MSKYSIQDVLGLVRSTFMNYDVVSVKALADVFEEYDDLEAAEMFRTLPAWSPLWIIFTQDFRIEDWINSLMQMLDEIPPGRKIYLFANSVGGLGWDTQKIEINRNDHLLLGTCKIRRKSKMIAFKGNHLMNFMSRIDECLCSRYGYRAIYPGQTKPLGDLVVAQPEMVSAGNSIS